MCIRPPSPSGGWNRMAAHIDVVWRGLQVPIPCQLNRRRNFWAGKSMWGNLNTRILVLLLFIICFFILILCFPAETGAIKQEVPHTTHQWSATCHTQCSAHITHRLFSKYWLKTNTQKEIKPHLQEMFTENMNTVFQDTWGDREGCLISCSVCCWWIREWCDILLGEWYDTGYAGMNQSGSSAFDRRCV